MVRMSSAVSHTLRMGISIPLGLVRSQDSLGESRFFLKDSLQFLPASAPAVELERSDTQGINLILQDPAFVFSRRTGCADLRSPFEFETRPLHDVIDINPRV